MTKKISSKKNTTSRELKTTGTVNVFEMLKAIGRKAPPKPSTPSIVRGKGKGHPT